MAAWTNEGAPYIALDRKIRALLAERMERGATGAARPPAGGADRETRASTRPDFHDAGDSRPPAREGQPRREYLYRRPRGREDRPRIPPQRAIVRGPRASRWRRRPRPWAPPS